MSALAPLAGFIANPPPAYAGDAALERARMALIDLVGVTLAGTYEPVAQLLARHHAASGGTGPATLIGLPGSATPVDAAFLNGAIGHALDLDDSNFVLGGHPSVVILPGLLALAETAGHSGRAVLEAYVVGFEAMCRIAAAVNMHHYEKGWHPTATLGIFGATAGAARLLRLDADRAAAALSLAVSFSAGVKENFGAMAKPVQVGQAASRGMLAAQLAALGATASETAFDGPRGFLTLYNGAGTYDLSRIAFDPDEPELMRSGIMFKRYACCGSTHVAIDAALALRSRDGFASAAIRAVRLEVNPRRRPHVDRPVITEPLGAKFSLQFTVAAALLDGAVSPGHFSAASVARADIAALMRCITVGDLPGVGKGLSQPCVLAVEFADGRRLETRLDGPLGRETSAYPTYMAQKFADCAGTVLPTGAVETLFRELCRFETAASVAPILTATRATAAPEAEATPTEAIRRQAR